VTRIPINPGRVDWSGENPGIYLKTDPDGDYTALALFFRVVLSPYGRGHAGFVLGAPDKAKGWPDAPNFIMTDNMALMRWIVAGWVTKMPTFRGRTGLGGMSWLDCESVEKRPGDLKTRYSETLRGSGVELQLNWRDMGPPIPVEVTAENSATKEHEMYSVFLEAGAAEIQINGTPLPGQVGSRQFFGRDMSTAFLAFSETWVTPEGSDAA
jgi:hypothetical protein